MIRLLRLMLLRPIERFLPQWLAVTTEPSTFVREHLRLGDTTNFLRAANFFLVSVSTAFLAELATVYLLGIGNLTEPFYWLFILVSLIPFVAFCFLLLRFVAPVAPKDVLHLSFYPLGAGIVTGAACALISSAVVGLLVAIGYIPDIRYDYTSWETGSALEMRVLRDCLKGESLVYTVLATGLQEAYSNLKPPIDGLSYLRPVITILYLLIAARVFMAALQRRKRLVFGLVLLAALLAVAANYLLLKGYFEWNFARSDCEEKLLPLSIERRAESTAHELALGLDRLAKENASDVWEESVRSEGRVLYFTFKFKRPIVDVEAIQRGLNLWQKERLKGYCSDKRWLFRRSKIIENHVYFSLEGERLTSFSLGPTDCHQW